MFDTVMSKIKLSIECSSHLSSFILYDENHQPICKEITARSDVLIYQSIPHLLNQLSITVQDVSEIIWGQGPGSFTGIRLCATWVQSLSYICNINVVPVCSLTNRVLEYTRKQPIKDELIYGYLPANRAYVYQGVWQLSKNGVLTLSEPVSLVEKQSIDARYIDLDAYLPNASNAFELVNLNPNKYEFVTDPFSIRPNYLFDQFS